MQDSQPPRPEQPRPQFFRERWRSLNGHWDFAIDPEGRIRDRRDGKGLDRRIIVPFAPESELSGIGETDFMQSVWYARDISIPPEWKGRRVLLHFGAVDWLATIYVDGTQVARHQGGSTIFTVDLTDHLTDGTCRLVVHALDDIRSGLQPGGKQSAKSHSWGCFYTRTTGIWQNVWLESAGSTYLTDIGITTTLSGDVTLTPRVAHEVIGLTFRVTATLEGTEVANAEAGLRPGLPFCLNIRDPQVWSPDSPTLYDLTFEIRRNGMVLDRVYAYCGLREVMIEGDRFTLNGQDFYHRFVLDQGFYPDGIWTAPSDEALKRDIALSMSMGFNGARLHQKVFEPRFHYWADRMGYLTWAESPSWGADPDIEEANGNMLAEWAEIVIQCRNHPSIIAWTPLNESGRDLGRDAEATESHKRLVERCATLTRRLDPTRPVNDASGWVHRDTDLWTVHSYEQDPAELKRQLSHHPDVFRNAPQNEPDYSGQPYILDEFGGAALDTKTERTDFANMSDARDAMEQGADWGYGRPPENVTEFENRIRAQVAAVDAIPHMRGWCYTQLTDVEQEQNGVLTYDRRPKLSLDTYKSIFSGKT